MCRGHRYLTSFHFGRDLPLLKSTPDASRTGWRQKVGSERHSSSNMRMAEGTHVNDKQQNERKSSSIDLVNHCYHIMLAALIRNEIELTRGEGVAVIGHCSNRQIEILSSFREIWVTSIAKQPGSARTRWQETCGSQKVFRIVVAIWCARGIRVHFVVAARHTTSIVARSSGS
jgi:hypothetical protein